MNRKKSNGGTALTNAAKSGHVKCVELLLRASAEVDTETERGQTALERTLQVLLSKKRERKLDSTITEEEDSLVQCCSMLRENGAVVCRFIQVKGHPHPLIIRGWDPGLCTDDEGWYCDGKHGPGDGCLSVTEHSERDATGMVRQSIDAKRYTCASGSDIDYCEECMRFVFERELSYSDIIKEIGAEDQ